MFWTLSNVTEMGSYNGVKARSTIDFLSNPRDPLLAHDVLHKKHTLLASVSDIHLQINTDSYIHAYSHKQKCTHTHTDFIVHLIAHALEGSTGCMATLNVV